MRASGTLSNQGQGLTAMPRRQAPVEGALEQDLRQDRLGVDPQALAAQREAGKREHGRDHEPCPRQGSGRGTRRGRSDGSQQGGAHAASLPRRHGKSVAPSAKAMSARPA